MSHQLQTVPFRGQTLCALLIDNVPHVAVKPICDNLGLSWKGQHDKLMRHPVLKSCIRVTRMRQIGDDRAREHTFLPLNKLNGWLFTIHADRVKPQCRARVLAYQRECFDALANHFMPGIGIEQPVLSISNAAHAIAAQAATDVYNHITAALEADKPAHNRRFLTTIIDTKRQQTARTVEISQAVKLLSIPSIARMIASHDASITESDIGTLMHGFTMRMHNGERKEVA